MLVMRMDTAVTEQSHDMKLTAFALDMLHRIKQHFVFEEVAVFDRLVDARQTLIDDAAGTDIQVTNLRIPHLSFRQPDIQAGRGQFRSEEHTSELQSRFDLVCRLLLEKKK